MMPYPKIGASFLKISLLSIAIVSLIFLSENHFLTQKSTHSKFEEYQKNKAKLAPNDWQFRQRAYPAGKIDKAAFISALAYRNELAKPSPTENTSHINPWLFAGPTNIGGRITDLEMPPSDQSTIYAGAASGGVFKSRDAGVSWSPIFDSAMNLSIGDMAIAASNENIIYVGTGEPNAGGGSLAYDGVGVYRSDNAGNTWSHIGLPDAGSTGKVLIDSDDPDLVYVGTMGRLFENNPERGVYRTKDGGGSWEQVLYINDSTGIADMAINPDQPDTLYAAAWQRVRRPERRDYGGPSSGIYRSYDGGDNWTKLTNGLPTSAGRIGIGISASNPAILYAISADPVSSQIQGIYKTTDHGDTWTSLPTTNVSSVPFMWWFGRIFVDPTNADVVYLASLNMHKSTDGGNSWGPAFSGVHVDQHAIYVHPQNPNFVVNGNDGGVYISSNEGVTYAKSNTLPITQFYATEIDYSFPERLYGGTQDNSTMRTLTGMVDDWEVIYFGDGFQTLVDPTDNNYVYTEYQYGNFAKSTDGGNSFNSALNGVSNSDRKNWNTPAIFHPNDPTTLYLGTNRLYKSTNRADSWTVISPDLTNGSGGGNLAFGTLTTISVSPVDDNIIYAGTDDGNVQVTKDGGASWTNVTGTLPQRWVTQVVADSQDANIVYVTLSGYRYGAEDGHVFFSSDQGTSWTDISGDLPDIPVNDLIAVPEFNYLYIATDVGVFYSKNLGGNWELLGNDLPNVVVTDLDYHPPTKKLVAATYGRGLYTTILEEEVAASIGKEVRERVSLNVYPNPFSDQTQIEFEIEKRGEYRLSVIDLNGREMKQIHKGSLTAGVHEFTLELSSIASGMYFAKLEKVGEGTIGMRRLVKR